MSIGICASRWAPEQGIKKIWDVRRIFGAAMKLCWDGETSGYHPNPQVEGSKTNLRLSGDYSRSNSQVAVKMDVLGLTCAWNLWTNLDPYTIRLFCSFL